MNRTHKILAAVMSCLLVSGTVNINIHNTQAKTTHKITHKKKAKKKSYCYLYEIETPSIKSISLKKNTLTISGKFERTQGTSYKLLNPETIYKYTYSDKQIAWINYLFIPTKKYQKNYKCVLKYKFAKKCPTYFSYSTGNDKISKKYGVSLLNNCVKRLKKVKDKQNDLGDYLHASIIIDHNKITDFAIDDGYM